MGSPPPSVLLCILIINYYDYNLCLRLETRRNVKFSALKARRSRFPVQENTIF